MPGQLQSISFEHGIAIGGSGVGASIAANKIVGVRAALIQDHFWAHQGIEDDNMNLICIGGRVTRFCQYTGTNTDVFKSKFFRRGKTYAKVKKKLNNEKKIKLNRICKKNKVKSIQDFGQSNWLDFFNRKIMDSEKLKS